MSYYEGYTATSANTFGTIHNVNDKIISRTYTVSNDRKSATMVIKCSNKISGNDTPYRITSHVIQTFGELCYYSEIQAITVKPEVSASVITVTDDWNRYCKINVMAEKVYANNPIIVLKQDGITLKQFNCEVTDHKINQEFLLQLLSIHFFKI